MIINLKNIQEILNDKLSVTQRGLLITILLVKDTKPEYTLAKLKSTIKIKEYYHDLITLHQDGYIVWSGYEAAKKSLVKKLDNPKVEEVINFMNKLYKRNFKANSLYATKDLRVRLTEHSLEDVLKVVANRYAEWKDDAVMEKHLNPTTIFRPSKFDKYLEEASRTKSGASFVSAKQLNLNQGDEIVFEMSDHILEKDVYTIKTYDLDSSGNRVTSGMLSKVYGSNLIKMLKAQANRIERGDAKEFAYIYQQT
jgi:uncharacterized phage protein (TIGR02220 family)